MNAYGEILSVYGVFAILSDYGEILSAYCVFEILSEYVKSIRSPRLVH